MSVAVLPDPGGDTALRRDDRRRVLVLDTAPRTRNSYIPLAIVEALRRNSDVASVRLATYRDAIDVFRRDRCDVFLAIGGAGGDLAILARLCAMASKSALWVTEDPYELEENLRVSTPFDLTFTNDLSCLPAYGRRGRHLPLAGSSDFHDIPAANDDASFLYDVCFVGTAWPNRVRTIDRLIQGIGRPIRAKIGLPGNPHLPPVELSDRSIATQWRVASPDLARLVNCSRITLNLERKFSAARPDQTGGSTPPPRLFENALAGGFQITLTAGGEAKRYFDPLTEVALCRTDDELLDRVRWALDNPGDRIAMARAAQARARAEHLYEHRTGRLLDELGSLDPAWLAAAGQTAAPRSVRRRLLIVSHNLLGGQPGGGVEVYQEELIDRLAQFDVFLLVPQVAEGVPGYTLIRGRTGERHRYGVPHLVTSEILHDPAHERVFERILIEFEIDVVHFQHAIGMPLSLPMIAKACGLPVVYTLHDFYLVCSRFNLIDHRGRFCDTAQRSPTECDICLASSGIAAGGQQRRRNFVAEVLGSVDRIVVNSPYTADYMRAIYPEHAGRLEVVEMLTPLRPPLPTVDERPEPKALQVVVPGNFTRAKGADTVIRIMSLLREEAIDFRILGRLEPDLEQHLRALALPRVEIQGGYEVSELGRLIAGSDVSLHLSIWPETYMISLNEAWASSVIPIVSDLGAPAERVREGIDGFKVDVDDAGRVCDLLRALAGDADLRGSMREAILARTVVTPAEHAGSLAEIYRDLLADKPVLGPDVTIQPDRDYLLDTALCGVRTNAAHWTRATHEWDAAPATVRPSSLAPNSQVWRTFPARFAHLPREIVDVGSERISVDRLEFDRAPAEFGSLVRRRIRLVGWAFAPGLGRPLDVVLHVKGNRQELFDVCGGLSRLDVGAHMGATDATTSGFDFDVDVSGLKAGSYRLSLLQVYDGRIADFGSIGDVLVAEASAAPVRPPRWEGPGPDFDGRRSSGDAAITSAGRCGEHENIVVEGYAFDREKGQVHAAVHVGFLAEGRDPVWIEAERVRAPAALVVEDPVYAFAGFRADVPAADLREGLYRLAVAETGRDGTLLHDIDDAIMVVGDRVVRSEAPRHHAPAPSVGGGLGAGWTQQIGQPPEEPKLHVDQIETDVRHGGGGARQCRRHLYLRGWAHIPDFGPEAARNLRLVGSLSTIEIPLGAMRRDDLAALFGPDAAKSGFETLISVRDCPPDLYRAELLISRVTATVAVPLNVEIDVTADQPQPGTQQPGQQS